ncbi:hypothetical protein D3C85_1137140 [compost metagenome]
MMGAAIPIWLYEGSKPIANVATPISVTVTMKVYLRPTISPMRPNTNAPKGRTANPAAKLRRVKMKAAVGLTPENIAAEIWVASAPARKKSYHSNMVPREDARITLRSLLAAGVGATDVMALSECAVIIASNIIIIIKIELAEVFNVFEPGPLGDPA